MNQDALQRVALEFAPLSGLHHLALFVMLVIAWSRREAAARLLPAYLAAAFATASYSLLSSPGARLAGAASIILSALWLHETIVQRGRLAFRRTPRIRLVLMGAAGVFAISYPGFSGELPSFIFSPLGVTLAPTVTASLALLNATEGPTNVLLHWTLTVVGLLVGAAGIAAGVWSYAVPLALSVYAVFLLAVGERLLPETGDDGPRSVEEIRRRMYSRRSMLPGPRDPRSGRSRGRRRAR